MQKLDLTDEERHQRHLEQMREWRRKNRERQTRLTRTWRKNHPERAKEITDKYETENAERRKQGMKDSVKRRKDARKALEELEKNY